MSCYKVLFLLKFFWNIYLLWEKHYKMQLKISINSDDIYGRSISSVYIFLYSSIRIYFHESKSYLEIRLLKMQNSSPNDNNSITSVRNHINSVRLTGNSLFYLNIFRLLFQILCTDIYLLQKKSPFENKMKYTKNLIGQEINWQK